MTSTCWQPQTDDRVPWSDDGCASSNRWTPGAFSDSRACIAVACLAVACSPQPAPDYTDLGTGPVYVCGEAPVVPPPEGGPGGGGDVNVLRAFSNGFSNGFS
jgi:hypothetical protein